MYQQQPFGTCKVKDGLYIGDEFAAKDLEFIAANKVGYIVNCSSEFMENLYESVGVMYFSFQWPEEQPELVAQTEFIDHVFEFVEESVNQGVSCLIVSLHGQSRACSMASIYLMMKYKWSLYKTLEFLNSRRNDLEIKTSFFNVLSQIESLLGKSLTTTWDKMHTPEETIIVNTYKNAQAAIVDPMYTQQEEFQKILQKTILPLIQWIDNPKIEKHNIGNQIRSILKGSRTVQYKEQTRKIAAKSFSVNKENLQPQVVKKVPARPAQPIRSGSTKKMITPPVQKNNQNRTMNQVAVPQKILRPKMPNFDLL